MPDINDNDRHIDELLQSLGEGWRYWPKKHAALERIVAERDSLRDELAAAKAELVTKADELAAAIKQRDEARREACLWALPHGVVWNEAMIARGKAIAAERGWDCFAEKEGGGA